MHEAPERLRSLILGLLERQDVTQAELARRIRRSEKHVSQTLTGAAGLSTRLAEQMVHALGYDLVIAVVPREGVNRG